MGPASTISSVIVVVFVIYAADLVTSSRCPPPSQIYEHTNLESCHSDHQCPQDKVCCVTPARTKACVQPVFGSHGTHDRHEHGRSKSWFLAVLGKECCHSDHQCPQDKVCCVTPARTKACVQPVFGSQGTYDRHEHGRNPNNGIYCGNKKCGPFEKCAEERGRATCKRA
ncbi:hypothetical protein O0L34_g3449 [Tuta absoluta]|nr:hypothetical protein O0L34_g3449 [Tuta absoluta]